MSTRRLTREEVEELVEAEDTIQLSSEYQQHDICLLTYIAKIDGRHWRFSFERSDNEGWMIYGTVEAEEVKPTERVVVEWVLV